MTAAGGLISVLVGAVLLRLTLTGTYGRYVRLGMGPWLAIAGVAVIVLGLVTLLHALRHTDPADADDHHGHGAGDRVGWLLLAPVAALLLVAPPTLGSYGVDRGAPVDIRSGGGVLDPLVPGAEPIPMTLLEFGRCRLDRVRHPGLRSPARPGPQRQHPAARLRQPAHHDLLRCEPQEGLLHDQHLQLAPSDRPWPGEFERGSARSRPSPGLGRGSGSS